VSGGVGMCVVEKQGRKWRNTRGECEGEMIIKRGEREWRADFNRPARPDVKIHFRDIQQYGQ
jgi:hypothetical protein